MGPELEVRLDLPRDCLGEPAPAGRCDTARSTLARSLQSSQRELRSGPALLPQHRAYGLQGIDGVVAISIRRQCVDEGVDCTAFAGLRDDEAARIPAPGFDGAARGKAAAGLTHDARSDRKE